MILAGIFFLSKSPVIQKKSSHKVSMPISGNFDNKGVVNKESKANIAPPPP